MLLVCSTAGFIRLPATEAAAVLELFSVFVEGEVDFIDIFYKSTIIVFNQEISGEENNKSHETRQITSLQPAEMGCFDTAVFRNS